MESRIMNLAEYERAFESFWSELLEEEFQHGAGLKESLEIVPIYQRHAELFGEDTVRALLDHRDGRAARYVARFACETYLSDRVKQTTEQIANAEAADRVEWDGQAVPYRYAATVLANEADPDRRHELERRILACTDAHNDLRRVRWAGLYEQTAALGYPNYLVMCETLWGVDLNALGGEMRALLDRTRERYLRELDRQAQTLGMAREELTPADLRHLFRAPRFDALFPAERLLPALRDTLRGLGIDLDEQTNVTLDTEPRPLKSPRAFCVPVRVPDDVRLVIMPKGGQDDYSSLMHEAGHLEHYAHCDRGLRAAYRYLGDNAVTESWAFLFDYLTENETWLTRALGDHDYRGFLELAGFADLWFLRRYAAKLLYELELHGGGSPESAADRYRQHLSDALAITIWPENYLSDVDDGFYCAAYLRAWALERQVRRRLKREHGDAWFGSPAAGAMLIALWRRGQEPTADEVAREIGDQGIDVGHLIESLLGARDD
jgi:hypothetical protein